MDRHVNQHTLEGAHGPEDLTAEVLIGRIVDGEALAADRARFEELAAVNPGLWKLLALRHQDDAVLAARFERETAGVERIDLPASPQPASRALRAPWWLAITG